MSRLARDGTAEPRFRETKFSGANGNKEILIFPVQLTTSRLATFPGGCSIFCCIRSYIHTYCIGMAVVPYSAITDDHTYILCWYGG